MTAYSKPSLITRDAVMLYRGLAVLFACLSVCVKTVKHIGEIEIAVFLLKAVRHARIYRPANRSVMPVR